MSTVSIKFFGTNDGMGSTGRGHSSFLMRASERVYLFDAGEPVSRSLKQAGVAYNAVDRLFLSHLHADHVGGLPMLLQAMWLEPRTKLLPIHLPPEGVELVKTMRRSMYLFDELMSFRIELLPLRLAQTIEDGGNRITLFPTTHLEKMKKQLGGQYPLGFECFAFRIETADGKSIVYSGDIGKSEDLAPALKQRTDLLISELAHFRPETHFEFLSRYDIGRIAFTHVVSMDKSASTVELPSNSGIFTPPASMTMREKIRKQAQQIFGDRAVMAEDGMELEV